MMRSQAWVGAVGVLVALSTATHVAASSPEPEPGEEEEPSEPAPATPAPSDPTPDAPSPDPPPEPPPLELSPGVYAGSNTVFAEGLFASLPDGSVTANVAYEGDFDLEIADDLTSEGRFVLGGEWDMEISTPEGDGTSVGSTGASGVIVGSGVTLAYAGTETNAFTVTFGGFSREFSNSGEIPPVAFTITAASCSEITGEWERAWEAVADAVGYDNAEVVTGDFWAIRTSDEEERARIEQFFDDWEAQFDGTAESVAGIDVSGLPPVYAQIKAVNRRIVELSALDAADSGPQWIDLIDEAAELSERVRNADPCVFGGRELQRNDYTYPFGVVRAALDSLANSDVYFDDATMRALASRAMQHNVVGPRSPNSDVSQGALDEFQGWVDSSVEAAGGDAEGAYDALVVASGLGLTLSAGAVGGGE